jgi:hypothetical protein
MMDARPAGPHWRRDTHEARSDPRIQMLSSEGQGLTVSLNSLRAPLSLALSPHALHELANQLCLGRWLESQLLAQSRDVKGSVARDPLRAQAGLRG